MGNVTATCVQRQFLASSAEVRAVSRGEAAGVLVDVRKLGEYDGSFKDNYGFFATAGHIPSCVYQGNWDELITDDGTDRLCDPAEVEARWRALGLHEGRGALIFYCGSGWRSSVTFLMCLMIGWDAKNYDGGWFAWSCGLKGSDCRVCRPLCGCNIKQDANGFTVNAVASAALVASPTQPQGALRGHGGSKQELHEGKVDKVGM